MKLAEFRLGGAAAGVALDEKTSESRSAVGAAAELAGAVAGPTSADDTDWVTALVEVGRGT